MNDEFEGMGGSYIIGKNGVRALVNRTNDVPPTDPEPPTLTKIITQDKPANAGFFTPVAPAESTTTTE